MCNTAAATAKTVYCSCVDVCLWSVSRRTRIICWWELENNEIHKNRNSSVNSNREPLCLWRARYHETSGCLLVCVNSTARCHSAECTISDVVFVKRQGKCLLELTYDRDRYGGCFKWEPNASPWRMLRRLERKEQVVKRVTSLQDDWCSGYVPGLPDLLVSQNDVVNCTVTTFSQN